jgi:hypothetical protein
MAKWPRTCDFFFMQVMPPKLFFVPPMECREVRTQKDLPQGKDGC